MLLAVYGLATLAGATLVFLVQPMAAKLLLPMFGGSPAVWTTSMLFFQAALLLGYGWAHLSTTRLGLRRQPVAQLVLLVLPLLVLPIALPAWSVPPEGVEPSLWLLLVLVAMVGAPYVAVTTASPVLQRWFSATDHRQAADPYFLYAMGNAGSLFGLLAYPFLIEPRIGVADQARLWAAGYVAFLVLSAAAALLLRRHRRAEPDTPPEPEAAPPVEAALMPSPVAAPSVPAGPMTAPVTRARRLRWIAFAFVPSSLMLGATSYITADVAAVPLLWVLPLSLYLLTFILAFSPRNPLTPRRMAALLPFAAVALAVVLVGAVALPLAAVIGLNLAVFFVAALLAHGRLAEDRPAPARLTEFYVLVAVGGALGGLFNAIVAPLVFESVLEYPLAIVLALLLRPIVPAAGASVAALRRARLLDLVVPLLVFVGALVGLAVLSRALDATGPQLAAALAAGAVATLLMVRRPVRFALSFGAIVLIPLLVGSSALYADRSFFGVNRVVDEDGIRLLVHGTTTHGGQHLDPARAREPLTYYHPTGPLGRTVEALHATRTGPLQWGVIGLGAGGLAAYVRPGDAMTYFEIDRVVIDIATDSSLFTYLSGGPEPVRTVLGDGRITLAEEPDGAFDVFVLDAFSGDAPPAHLLTTEALDLYRSKLAPGGILLFNVSNRYVDVGAVVSAGLVELGVPGYQPIDPDPATPPAPEKQISGWLVAAHDEATLAPLRELTDGAPLPVRPEVRAWTDDFSDIVSAITWGG
jgi:hypothetical protein